MKPLPLLLISTFFLCSSCNDSPSDHSSQLTGMSIVVIDQFQFESLWTGLTSDRLSSDPFGLKAVYSEGSKLKIDVAYAGGCKKHSFELIWPEVTHMIYPPRYTVILKHLADGDACEAYVPETLIFDLSQYELGLTPETVGVMDLHVINGSDPDESLELSH